jgi:hypothetical protein
VCANKRAGSWQEQTEARTTDATVSTAKRRRHVYMETIYLSPQSLANASVDVPSQQNRFFILLSILFFPIPFLFFLFVLTSCSWLMGGGRKHSDTPLSPLACMYVVGFSRQ